MMVVVGVVLSVLVVGGLRRRGVRFPGILESAGSFEAVVDLSDAGTREERERDFTRICQSQLHLHFTEMRQGKASPPRLLELKPRESFAGYAAQIRERYLGAESEVLTQHAFSLVSATTPFDFATQFKVPPNFSETRYIVVHQPERRALRIFWAAFVSDNPEIPPPARLRVMPLFLCFVSEPLTLLDNPHGRIVTRFAYSCRRNSHAFIGKAIADCFEKRNIAWLA